MFRRKNLPACKPEPPITCEHLLVAVIIILLFGFSFSVSILKSINENLRHEEANQGYSIPEVPIAPYSR